MATAPSMHVCMESSDWLKGVVVNSDGAAGNSNSSSPSPELLAFAKAPQPLLERRLHPLHDHPLKCPRCDSSHTKFCYYNNYSLSQPRYFCKACRRYWTKGGSLRNVPVGGGCRKNKRPAAPKKTATGRAQIFDGIDQYRGQQYPVDLQLSNLNYFSCDVGVGDHNFDCGSLGFLNFEGQEEVKPGNRMLSLEWSEQGCSDLYGYANGIGIWHGHGSSSSAAM